MGRNSARIQQKQTKMFVNEDFTIVYLRNNQTFFLHRCVKYKSAKFKSNTKFQCISWSYCIEKWLIRLWSKRHKSHMYVLWKKSYALISISLCELCVRGATDAFRTRIVGGWKSLVPRVTLNPLPWQHQNRFHSHHKPARYAIFRFCCWQGFVRMRGAISKY